MGLVLGGRLHRGRHGAAGEIGYMPLGIDGTDEADARRRGSLEASASAAGVVRAARRAGIRRALSARDVFAAAERGDGWAVQVVEDEAEIVARSVCAVVTVVDPDLIVLGGGLGQAAGFVDAVEVKLRRLAPVMPEIRVSALGADAVVDGREGDIAAAAHALAPAGVDAVLALAGGDALERCVDALRPGGRLAYPSGVRPEPKPRSGISIVRYDAIAGAQEFERLNKAIIASKLQVPIAADYRLADAARAHERLEAGHVLGKIVLQIR